MSGEIRLPSLGADMEAATLVEWRIEPGRDIRPGDVIALIETDKGLIDLESFDTGRVAELLATPGTRLPVGTVIARLEGATAEAAAPVAPIAAAAAVTPAGPPRASPAARARAHALGLDLATLQGTGPGGAVRLEDLAAHVAHGTHGTHGTPRTMREAIGATMSRAKREIPHYYVQTDVDFTACRDWLARFNASQLPAARLLPSVLLLKAVALASRERPGFNGRYETTGFVQGDIVNLGVAIALRGGGLVAPAILDADSKPLTGLMQELRELVERARIGRLRSGELMAGTITVTSLGDEGADLIFPIIHPPQVAMVGFGSVRERPWAAADKVEARPVIGCTLAADHRVTDGRQGARFLARINALLQRPEDLQ